LGVFTQVVFLLEHVQRKERMSDTLQSTAVEVIPEHQLEQLGAGLPVTRADLDTLRGRIALLKEFVAKQLKTNVDYGIIPGCKVPSLYQPGAQKFARLFGLTIRKECTHREVDRENNYAAFTYMASVYHAKTGQLIAQCEGSTNSQEKKWATRTVKGGGKEITPVTDVLNTLQKMAQKRAFVGAVIEACAASDFFTQDIDSPEEAAALGIRPEPSRASVSIPKTVTAHSNDETEVELCGCGNSMMVSKYPNKVTGTFDWYCNPKAGGCGASKPRAV
jgi:hypothetical protein